ncbi:unnamed protein product [Chironomus riparius]|uniref:Uncharacterized protein n=1 Tax=Chironomus riparius TaxID=315576 RepID=A0A9N9WW17_9DIPT|nr:unnamed protein product [Chironomus riparius]
MPEMFVKKLDKPQIIALFTIIIDGTKLGIAVADLFTGHLQYLDSVMKRVYIHSILLCILGLLGIICSILLFIKRFQEQRTNIIIFWLCQKGIGVFHQIFFALDIILAVTEKTDSSTTRIVVILALLTLVIIEIVLIIFIVKYYQSAESIEDQSVATRPNYLAQLSITELFGNAGSQTSIICTDPIALAASMAASNTNNSNC